MSKSLSGEYVVRPVRQSDLPALAAIDMGYDSSACYRIRKQMMQGRWEYVGTLESLPMPYRIAYDDWDWTEVPGFLSNLAEERVYGAFLTSSPSEPCVGLLELRLLEEQQAGEIASLYVHRPLRGHGIGTALVQAGLAWAKKHHLRALLATTQAIDVPAVQFYQSLGFVICGVHECFYCNDGLATGEAAIFLAYTLPDEP